VSKLNDLWELPLPAGDPKLGCSRNEADPPRVKAYLAHAIAEGTPRASAVRLQMTGEIKLKKWLPFTATQVIRLEKGFVWGAKATSGLMFIKGFDQFIDGVGEMRWKLFGVFPVMTGTGPDISRSAGDRFAIEHIFMPSAFCASEAAWAENGNTISVTMPNSPAISLGVEPSGRVKSISMLRWGSPTSGSFSEQPFGGFVDEELTWDGYTIPSRLRLGWNFGSDRFDEGEFFRATITHAQFK
jgi:hypothetical protein